MPQDALSEANRLMGGLGRTRDNPTLLIAADAFEEAGEQCLADGLRKVVRHNHWPFHGAGGRFVWWRAWYVCKVLNVTPTGTDDLEDWLFDRVWPHGEGARERRREDSIGERDNKASFATAGEALLVLARALVCEADSLAAAVDQLAKGDYSALETEQWPSLLDLWARALEGQGDERYVGPEHCARYHKHPFLLTGPSSGLGWRWFSDGSAYDDRNTIPLGVLHHWDSADNPWSPPFPTVSAAILALGEAMAAL